MRISLRYLSGKAKHGVMRLSGLPTQNEHYFCIQAWFACVRGFILYMRSLVGVFGAKTRRISSPLYPGPRGFQRREETEKREREKRRDRERRERERSGERKPLAAGDANFTIILSINITRSINKQPVITYLSVNNSQSKYAKIFLQSGGTFCVGPIVLVLSVSVINKMLRFIFLAPEQRKSDITPRAWNQVYFEHHTAAALPKCQEFVYKGFCRGYEVAVTKKKPKKNDNNKEKKKKKETAIKRSFSFSKLWCWSLTWHWNSWTSEDLNPPH